MAEFSAPLPTKKYPGDRCQRAHEHGKLPELSKDSPAHLADLSAIEPGEYDLVCLPLKIEGADGAPARAVLRRV